MMRRVSALITCLVVLSLPVSGSRVCETMSNDTARASSAGAQAHHDHDAPQSHSDHSSGGHSPIDHCTGTTSCAGVALSTTIADAAVGDSRRDAVIQIAGLFPPSQHPDLEPPPPKA